MNVRDSTPLPEELPRDAQQNGYYDDDIHLAADADDEDEDEDEDEDDEIPPEELQRPLHAYISKDCEISHLLRDAE